MASTIQTLRTICNMQRTNWQRIYRRNAQKLRIRGSEPDCRRICGSFLLQLFIFFYMFYLVCILSICTSFSISTCSVECYNNDNFQVLITLNLSQHVLFFTDPCELRISVIILLHFSSSNHNAAKKGTSFQTFLFCLFTLVYSPVITDYSAISANMKYQ